MNKLKSLATKTAVLASGIVAGSAFAAGEGTNTATNNGVDLSALTNSVDFSGVLTAVMAIAATLVTLYAGYAGIRWVLRMVKGA